jgi:hypothetical protein
MVTLDYEGGSPNDHRAEPGQVEAIAHRLCCMMMNRIMGHISMSRHSEASVFKANCFTLTDVIARTDATLVITKTADR